MHSFVPPLLRPEQRQYTRVVFTRTIRLHIDGARVGEYAARNLSMGGVFMEGENLQLTLGKHCTLELHEKGQQSSLILKISAKISRIEDTGVAVEFLDMEDDSFMFLQTMVLYASDDPIGIAQDFLEDFCLLPQAEKSGSYNR
ncbi:MAG: hypothetical protein CSB34_06390 [Desulfobulbus propionicus]|nr:MAG: hypothetical protein CSB34_06390 [Desulfobulbus propionicus]